jgi:hypothetical protein
MAFLTLPPTILYAAGRDVRTMHDLAKSLAFPKAEWDIEPAVKHDPLEDAAAQAQSIVAIYKLLRRR